MLGDFLASPMRIRAAEYWFRDPEVLFGDKEMNLRGLRASTTEVRLPSKGTTELIT